MKTLATITLNVPQCSQGLHLRWYANGWHYLTLQVGDESYLTAGLFSNTEANAKQRIAVEDVPAANLDALIALARVGSFDVLTPKGWRNGTFDGGDIATFETDANYYRAEFMLNVYGKTYPYSPIVIAGVDPIVLVYPLAPVEVLQGDTAILPTTVTVKRESEAIADASVTWGAVDTTVAGSFVIYGVVAGTDLKASVTLTVNALTDLAILKRIREANPTSQLPARWADSKDPYTQWVGASWSGQGRLVGLAISESGVSTLTPYIGLLRELLTLYCYGNNIQTIDVTSLTKLTVIDCSSSHVSSLFVNGLPALREVTCYLNNLVSIDTSGLAGLVSFSCFSNKLLSLATLTSIGLITQANFTHNLMPPAEVARLKALGFTDAQLLPQNL